MRFKVMAGFSLVLIILGVASLGALLQDLGQGVGEDTCLGAVMAGWFLGGGGLLYWAARKRYAVDWRVYPGGFLVFFGFVGASIEADSIANLRAEEPVLGFVLAGAFAVAGLLIARSGYLRSIARSREGFNLDAQAAVPRHAQEHTSGAYPAVPEEAVQAGSPERD